jgi:serine/threonine-protein kinase HipA
MNRKALPSSLWVYLEQDRIGTLYPTEPLSFEYTAEWIARPDAKALHPDIPIGAGRIATPQLHAFFENLLPEGNQRKLIGMRHQVSSVFGLLATVGGDTAGNVVLTPEGQPPSAPVYQELTWQQVHALIHADAATAAEREAIEAAAAGLPKPRISVSGAQFKMLLLVTSDGMPKRPMGASPSTHILKPDMVRTDIKVFASAVNETIVMRAAQLCGLPTASVSYQPVAQACLVERYDRIPRADGTLERLWQADFCQLLGKPSDVKYEHDGGPGFKDCYDLLATSAQPAVDRRNLLRWLFFNLYVGNNDSHAKNLALLATGEGLRLAPFYDLMSTRVYAGLGPSFAFSIGGEFEPGKMTGKHLVLLAEALGVAPKYLVRIARGMADQVDTAINTAAGDIHPHIDPSQQVLAERLVQLICKNVKQMRKRLLGDEKPSPSFPRRRESHSQ